MPSGRVRQRLRLQATRHGRRAIDDLSVEAVGWAPIAPRHVVFEVQIWNPENRSTRPTESNDTDGDQSAPRRMRFSARETTIDRAVNQEPSELAEASERVDGATPP